jgi:hypothetical protein
MYELFQIIILKKSLFDFPDMQIPMGTGAIEIQFNSSVLGLFGLKLRYAKFANIHQIWLLIGLLPIFRKDPLQFAEQG